MSVNAGRIIGIGLILGMFGEAFSEPVSNLTIIAIEPVAGGMAIGVSWPKDFTDRLDVFARESLAPTGWSLQATGLATAGTNELWWADTPMSANTSMFYRVGNADLDSDGDGLPDARERLMYGTNEGRSDTDGDELADGWEVEYGLRPLNPADAGDDPDNDGYDNLLEFNLGLDPLAANTADVSEEI